MACPMITLLSGTLNWVDTQIQALLQIDQSAYESADIESAWRSIRNIAYIVLVPIMLVMVLGTALNFNFIDAYTVRRAMPRFGIALLYITISWELNTFLIGFSNAVGTGVLGIMTQPFLSEGINDLTLESLFGAPAGNPWGIFYGLVTNALFGVGVAIAIWLFGGTLLLAAAFAFLVLLLRQMFVLALLLIAPLAILAWIFPGNDSLWKAWWSIFSKLLMMFPIIMAIIAVGRIFAFILVDSPGGSLQGTFLTPLMKLAAYMLPYAFIPFTFKLAGGMFATLTGMVNDRSKGLFDRQRQARGAKLERTGNQKMFKGAAEGSFRSKLNTVGATVMNANRAGYDPRRWRGRLAGALSENASLQSDAMMEDKQFNTWSGNDTLAKAAAETNNADELREYLLKHYGSDYAGPHGEENLRKDIAKVEETRRKYAPTAFKQAALLKALAGGTAYGYSDDDDLDSAEWLVSAGKIAGGDNSVLATIVAKGRSAAMGAGRVDSGGGGFGKTFDIARKLRQGADDSGNAYDLHDASRELAKEVVDSQGAGVLVHASMKPKAIRKLVPELQDRMQQAITAGNTTGDTRGAAQQFAALSAIYESLNATSPNKANIVGNSVLNQEIDIATLSPQMKEMLAPALLERQPDGSMSSRITGTINYQRAIEALRSNPEFTQFRREYQSQIERDLSSQRPPEPGQGAQTGAPTGF